MDAFTVSVSNALAEPEMKKGKGAGIAGTYAFFQFGMPLVGWFLVRTLLQIFTVLRSVLPWISFLLLGFLGLHMILECLREAKNGEPEKSVLTLPVLLLQGLATSMDALSVGLTTESYSFPVALLASVLIAAVTFGICLFGLFLGNKIGSRVRHAELFGGCLLILIGVEILLKYLLS